MAEPPHPIEKVPQMSAYAIYALLSDVSKEAADLFKLIQSDLPAAIKKQMDDAWGDYLFHIHVEHAQVRIDLRELVETNMPAVWRRDRTDLVRGLEQVHLKNLQTLARHYNDACGSTNKEASKRHEDVVKRLHGIETSLNRLAQIVERPGSLEDSLTTRVGALSNLQRDLLITINSLKMAAERIEHRQTEEAGVQKRRHESSMVIAFVEFVVVSFSALLMALTRKW